MVTSRAGPWGRGEAFSGRPEKWMAKKVFRRVFHGFLSREAGPPAETTPVQEPLVVTPPPGLEAEDAEFLDAEFVARLQGIDKVGRYEIVRKLGQGGTGIVYLGRDPYIKRPVAIKISNPASDASRERFFIEAQSAGRLHHPNIVSIYDAGLFRDFCYITFEYIEGPTLEAFCEPDHLLPMNRVLEIGFNVANALEYAHQQGIIHRDIKPSNIMIDPADTPRITDFGIAQMAEHTAKLSISGTPSYMSPEQVKEGVAQKESDLFSLGCVLYELLSGKKAFVGDNFFAIMYKIVHDDPVPLSQLRPDLPPAVIEVVQKAMAKDLAERFQTGMDLAYHLRLAIQGLEEPLRKEKNVIDQIHHIPFFQNFSRDQVRELVQTASIVRIRRGGTIVAEGEIDDTFYVLLNGRALVMKEGRSLAEIAAGECFGEMAYITKQARSADVVASTDCILMKISATLLNRSSDAIQLLFFKNFALTLVRRLNQTKKKD
jgi:predicted Ser/Thr protein kinase